MFLQQLRHFNNPATTAAAVQNQHSLFKSSHGVLLEIFRIVFSLIAANASARAAHTKQTHNFMQKPPKRKAAFHQPALKI